MGGEQRRALSQAIRFAAGAVFAGWVMIWVLSPTDTYSKKWRPSIRSATASTYFGSQGSNILIFTLPILVLSILGCLYAHLRTSSSSRQTGGNRMAAWRRPLLTKGPLGIISSIEAAFILTFLTLVVWCFTTYLRTSFARINSSSSTAKVWEAKLDSAALRLGLVGNILLAFLFFPVTRGSSLLPLAGLTSESSVRYHIWIGHSVMALFTSHGLCYIVLWISTGRIEHLLQWSKVGESNIAGELALFCGLALWLTTFHSIRRKMFEVFFYTHQLYALFLLFFLLHVGISFFCLVLPGVYLFLLDRFLRFLQSRNKAQLLSARILPPHAVELSFAKHPELKYTAASVVFINVPIISKLQWHPFTVTSSSNLESETLSVVIKKEGSWTENLYRILSTSDHLDISVEGPYGPVSDHFLRYEHLILISGGIGITPFIGMIRELIYHSNEKQPSSPSVHLVSAFKTSSELAMLNLLLPADTSGLRIRIDAYVTRERNEGGGWKNQCRTVFFNPLPSASPVSALLGPSPWIWVAVVVGSSFAGYLLMLALVHRFYIYPIDRNTNRVYSYTAKALLNLLLMCVAIGGAAVFAVAKERRRRRMKVEMEMESSTRVAWPWEDGIELESLPGEAVAAATIVHYGARPDLKRILMECKEGNTGVFASGPSALREDVAAICASRSLGNLNFESVSFTW